MTIIAADTHYLVVGLGATGLSCVRYLVSRGKKVSVLDSRMTPPNLSAVQQELPQVTLYLGSFDESVLASADYLVMSPGVALSTPEIQTALDNGAKVTSDIELFLQEYQGKVIAITGSNAKSTVTAWLGQALAQAELKVLVAGNIGLPVLNEVGVDYDIAVLELSSFQLELLGSLKADVATILNVSEDHMDRYDSYAQYVQAKQRIYFGCKAAVFNQDDALTQPLVPDDVAQFSFSAKQPDLKQYGFIEKQGELWLAHGFDAVMPAAEVSLPGSHNQLNALAVLALADAVDNPRAATIKALSSFDGLAFRCQFVRQVNEVRYFNDSKATNVGSTLAAIAGLGDQRKANIILLVGGQSKGQDFSPMQAPVEQFCKKVLAYGEDKTLLANVLNNVQLAENLDQAFELAQAIAQPGDVVLLSPACASFDQFKNFEARGAHFNQLVGALV